jgi:hypothetical protein
MARSRRLGPGKCVHCLKDVEERNSDHVFPASWYPDSTPPNLEEMADSKLHPVQQRVRQDRE